MEGCMDGLMVEWMHGWVDGWISKDPSISVYFTYMLDVHLTLDRKGTER